MFQQNTKTVKNLFNHTVLKMASNVEKLKVYTYRLADPTAWAEFHSHLLIECLVKSHQLTEPESTEVTV